MVVEVSGVVLDVVNSVLTMDVAVTKEIPRPPDAMTATRTRAKRLAAAKVSRVSRVSGDAPALGALGVSRVGSTIVCSGDFKPAA